jgi:NAD(P)-dependent dehydrogenase (short-subunit alcohol dehydrogenase family)
MKRSVTEDGIETNLAINYLSHFLLTNLLFEVLKAGAPSRVMTVSGAPGTLSKLRIRFDDIQFEQRYHPIQAFLEAGLARALFSFELARRWNGTGITANTFHPGLIRSNLKRGLPWYLRWPASVAGLFMSTRCRTGIHLATAPELEGVNGRFFVNKRAVGFHPTGYDVQAEAHRLWELSEELVKI